MSTQRNPASDLLPFLAAAFPHTFFADPKQVRPLNAFLYRDLRRLAKAGALPAGIDPTQLKPYSALVWETHRVSERAGGREESDRSDRGRGHD